MVEINDNADNTPKRSSVKRWCTAISIFYICVYCWLFWNTQICGAMEYRVDLLPDRYLACRSINELGDALAGLFAPLAFLWLVGAVLIQSEELDDTREVMKKQLDASLQQVKETKASTELFNEQTLILKRQQEIKEQERCDEIFDAMLVRLLTIDRNHDEFCLYCRDTETFSGARYRLYPKTGHQDQSQREVMFEFGYELKKLSAHLHERPYIELSRFEFIGVYGLLRDMTEMVGQLGGASKTKQLNASILNLPEKIVLIEEILKTVQLLTGHTVSFPFGSRS